MSNFYLKPNCFAIQSTNRRFLLGIEMLQSWNITNISISTQNPLVDQVSPTYGATFNSHVDVKTSIVAMKSMAEQANIDCIDAQVLEQYSFVLGKQDSFPSLLIRTQNDELLQVLQQLRFIPLEKLCDDPTQSTMPYIQTPELPRTNFSS